MLDSLLDIEIAYSMLKETGEAGVDPIDVHYQNLKCPMEVCLSTIEERRWCLTPCWVEEDELMTFWLLHKVFNIHVNHAERAERKSTVPYKTHSYWLYVNGVGDSKTR